MANRTDPLARTIHGTNPQNLVEKIVRSKIYQNNFWKEQCFGLTAETLVDKAMELDHIGGTYGGNRKPTPFICLVLKMLQIQPDKEIVVEFIKNDDYKYVRALGAFYLRLTGTDNDVYSYLEPLYNDYRKLRMKLPEGNYSLSHVDDFVDHLLTKDYACDIALPRIKKRWTLESIGSLEPRKSVLEDDFEEEEGDVEPASLETSVATKDRERERERERERNRDRDEDRKSHRHRDREHDREGRGRDRDRDRDRRRREGEKRGRSRSRDRKRRGNSGSPSQEDGKKKKGKKEDGTDHPDPEIAEANKLRAKLGLAPLRP